MNYCQNCGLANKQQNKCSLTGLPINLNKDYCSKFTTQPDTCDLCHNIITSLNSIIETQGDKFYLICNNCAQTLQQCISCQQYRICEFETNSDPTPKTINQQTARGNMIMQSTIKNPSRIEKFCPNCNCWNNETKVCLKDFHIGCINHKTIKF